MIKEPPHSQQAEQSVIGGLLLDNRKFSEVAAIINRDDFYSMSHALIFDGMESLAMANKPIDVTTLCGELEASNILETVGGLPYIAEIANNTPTAYNIKAYAEIVRERSVLRQLIRITNNVANNAYDTQGRDSESIIELAYDSLRTIKLKGDSDMPTLQDALLSAFNQLERRFNNDGALTGLPTGFTVLDESTNGLQKGELYIIAGRPASGKSTIALNIAIHVAMQNKVVPFFSLEMPRERIIDKCWSSVGGVYYEAIKTGKLSDTDWSMVSHANAMIQSSGLIIDDKGDQTIQSIVLKCKRLHAKRKIDLIVIDYLQLVRVHGANRLDEVSEVSRQLKALAKDLECPVIALAQLNRGVESRSDKRPKLADLRESGQIEQDADFILFLYRDEYYYPDLPMNKNIAELIIAKHRFGETGMKLLHTELNKSKFSNITSAVNYIPNDEGKKSGGFNG